MFLASSFVIRRCLCFELLALMCTVQALSEAQSAAAAAQDPKAKAEAQVGVEVYEAMVYALEAK